MSVFLNIYLKLRYIGLVFLFPHILGGCTAHLAKYRNQRAPDPTTHASNKAPDSTNQGGGQRPPNVSNICYRHEYDQI